MRDLSTPMKIKEVLHQSMQGLGTFGDCALLEYPRGLNIGSHLLWLSAIFYLTDVLKAKIKYVAGTSDFSGDVMVKRIGKAPLSSGEDILETSGGLGGANV